MAGTTAPITSVKRAFDVIDALWKLDGAGPTELARTMDIRLFNPWSDSWMSCTSVIPCIHIAR
ncbi:hypothetical protein [Natrialba aegyptia]|uniref:Uncharacterized protein n=1 Tax=Natrialba aegyptia DSM 13077 TaxID=1227491 RepID=M0ALE7_9EURY|nr:hypothetical protein [Natrialba aegyptia]ELY99161.1 hypothetical protein C480_20584 [Natrialba aegyptia DSM 13077]